MNYLLRRRGLGKSSCRGVAEQSTTGIQVVNNYQGIPDPQGGVVFRWGCTSEIPFHDKIVLNKSEAIHEVGDKANFRMKLYQNNLAMPTALSIRDYTGEYPVIIRPQFHSQGRHIIKAINREAVVRLVNSYSAMRNHYISQYIPKVAEYRVFICQSKVVWVAKKYPANPDSIAWNVARGGRFENIRWKDWPTNVIRNSINSFNLSGLDYGGVDVMVDANGVCYCLEINSAPSQTSPYRISCVAKVFDWIVNNQSVDRIESDMAKKTYSHFIHPAFKG